MQGVSIHATLAGGDIKFCGNPPSSASFYPRHPRGWRRNSGNKADVVVDVSIHATLAGGDVKMIDKDPDRWLFLSTPPSRVATSTKSLFPIRFFGFYPRHPRGWRQCVCQHYGVRFGVSIHATLAGGDGLTVKGDGSTALFLSTPPSRVATWQRSTRKTSAKLFLSTPPSRVATRPGSRGTRRWDCFYPRHPRGWRRRQPPKATFRQPCFYPRHPRGWRPLSAPPVMAAFLFLSTPPSRVATIVTGDG